jgi:hypothetical protein
VVKQLADLLGCFVACLVLGGHPYLGGLLNDLLADRMHASIQRRDGARARGAGRGFLGELSEERVERLDDGDPRRGVGW